MDGIDSRLGSAAFGEETKSKDEASKVGPGSAEDTVTELDSDVASK